MKHTLAALLAGLPLLAAASPAWAKNFYLQTPQTTNIALTPGTGGVVNNVQILSIAVPAGTYYATARGYVQNNGTVSDVADCAVFVNGAGMGGDSFATIPAASAGADPLTSFAALTPSLEFTVTANATITLQCHTDTTNASVQGINSLLLQAIAKPFS